MSKNTGALQAPPIIYEIGSLFTERENNVFIIRYMLLEWWLTDRVQDTNISVIVSKQIASLCIQSFCEMDFR